MDRPDQRFMTNNPLHSMPSGINRHAGRECRHLGHKDVTRPMSSLASGFVPGCPTRHRSEPTPVDSFRAVSPCKTVIVPICRAGANPLPANLSGTTPSGTILDRCRRVRRTNPTEGGEHPMPERRNGAWLYGIVAASRLPSMAWIPVSLPERRELRQHGHQIGFAC